MTTRPSDAPPPPHGVRAHLEIRNELVRLTLPHHPSTDRPELEAELVEPYRGPQGRRNRKRN